MKRRQDIFVIKQYDEDTFKIVRLKSVRARHEEKNTTQQDAIEKGIDLIFPPKKEKEEETNYERLDESISRTKSRIYEIARCNPWEYFVTLTLDKTKIDCYDIKGFTVKFNRMISDTNKDRERKIQYMIIPEKHKNGAFHFHGFIMGLTEEDVRKNKNKYLEWGSYRDKFGYCSLSQIRSIEACSAYCKKYITKDLRATIKKKGANMYYCSLGLSRGERVYMGYGEWAGTEDKNGFFKEWDFVQEDGYCAIVTVNRQQLLANFKPIKEKKRYEKDN